MTRRRRVARAVVAIGAGALVTTLCYAVSATASDKDEVLGPGVVRVDVGIEHSHFDLGTLRVAQGTLVEFVVDNRDPIDHELIVGDEEVHREHEQGTESRHPPVPGEVSVAPEDRSLTFYEFDQPGSMVYACHLPGHLAYGMHGTVEVVPSAS